MHVCVSLLEDFIIFKLLGRGWSVAITTSASLVVEEINVEKKTITIACMPST